ncbi:hypothetical protein SALBM311S_09383 [Streptomyces alboniger]
MEHTPGSLVHRGRERRRAARVRGSCSGVVLVVMMLGCALTAWFLLRGYKRKDD